MTDGANNSGIEEGADEVEPLRAKQGAIRIRTEADLISLPERFVRVGERGRTWDLPRRFANYKAVSHAELSVAGAARSLFCGRRTILMIGLS